jgi:hypothetical protein
LGIACRPPRAARRRPWYDAGMRRRVVNVLAVVSAVVCVLSLSVVGRSFFWADQVRVPMGQQNTYYARTVDGQLLVMHISARSELQYSSTSTAEERPTIAATWRAMTRIRWLGIGWITHLGTTVVIVPLWPVPIVTAVLPVWWWRVRRRAGGRGFEVEVGSRQSAAGSGDGGG